VAHGGTLPLAFAQCGPVSRHNLTDVVLDPADMSMDYRCTQVDRYSTQACCKAACSALQQTNGRVEAPPEPN
jgi:hypothetical protein